MTEIENIFSEQGGVFCIPATEFKEKLTKIKAFIFDWDGVFNDGTKDHQGSSAFSEIDAMGTNLLRFSHYLHKNTLPIVAVMSGERNVLSFQLGNREHFHSLYYKVKNKVQAFEHFLAANSLQAEEVAFVFDDVLDLGLSERCGLRLMVNRNGNPLFRNYVVKNNLTDYLTAQPSGQFAVREICELLIGTNGNYDSVVQHRSHFTSVYEQYLKARQQIKTESFTWDGNGIIAAME